MTRRWLIGVFILLQVVSAPPSMAQFIRLEQGQLRDRNGNCIHGINSSGLEFGNGNSTPRGGPYSYWHRHSPDEYQNIRKWGFNLVRLPISWANLEPRQPAQGSGGAAQHAYNGEYLQAIDEAVQGAAAAGLPVVLSMHHNQWSAAHSYQLPNGRTISGGGMPAWLYPDGDQIAAEDALFANEQNGQQLLADAWVMLARRYARLPNVVGIDVYNEAKYRRPTERAQAEAGLVGLYERVGEAIHAANPRLLLIFQDFADRDPRLTRLPAIPGAVYSFHTYQPWPGAQSSVQAHVQRAKQLGAPVLVGEFGRRGDANWKESLQMQTNYFKENNVPWCLWAYQFYQWPLFGQSGEGPLDEEQLSIVQAGM